MNWLEAIVAYVFSSTLLLSIISYFGKKFFEFYLGKSIENKRLELNKELEIHKKDLEHQNEINRLEINKNLEEYKVSLEKLKLEYQIQFSHLHQLRTEVVIGLYRKINKVQRSMLVLTSGFRFMTGKSDVDKKEEQDKIKEANDCYGNFIDYYDDNKILFSDEVCSIIDNIQKSIRKMVWITLIQN